jgi:hypothetical protein
MNEPTIWSSLLTSLLPLVVTVVTALVGIATTVITVRLNSWFGLTNENQQRANEQLIRNVLHDAVWSAVKYAAQKTGLTADQLAGINGAAGPSTLTTKEFIDVAIGYVRSKNPDTAVAAGLPPGAKGDAGLTEIIVSKVPDLLKILVEAVPGGAILGPLLGGIAEAVTKPSSAPKAKPSPSAPASPRRGT